MRQKKNDMIVIDEKAGLVFPDEKKLYAHFEKDIAVLEKEFSELREKKDFSDEQMEELEDYLESTIDDPDEVWEDVAVLDGQPVYHFLRTFGQKDKDVHYIAVCYVCEEIPTFVYLHFASKYRSTQNQYRRGEIVYSRSFRDTEECALEGDALSEGDELAIGLCEAMLKVRSSKDIAIEDFAEYVGYREESIEEADEIWRSTDLDGNILVSFVREYGEVEENLHYVVVTVEDVGSKVHSLLFSFPTRDPSLVDRYRHGENLQADEVIQESSH